MADPPPGPPAWLAQLLTGINAQHNTDMQALITASRTETDRLIAAIPALVPPPHLQLKHRTPHSPLPSPTWPRPRAS